jgi:hypothetical protein
LSHIVTIQTEVRDPTAIHAACERLKLPAPVRGTAKLFTTEATGLLVTLPRWRYPVVCRTEVGAIAFDNYGGKWGKQQELDRFLQAYAVEKTRLEARKQGHDVVEQALIDGSIKLTVCLGGTA